MKTPLLLVIAACVAPTIAAPETLDPTNVHRLSVAWTYDTGDSTEAVGKGADRPAFEATPVYSDGRLFLSTPLGTLVALDAERGTEVWRTDIGIREDAHYGDPANRGPVLSGSRLFVGTIDARLVCLQSRDGSRCPEFGKNGEIDLTKGLRHPPKYAGEYGVTSPPAVYRNLVIVGSSIGDNSRARMASGEVRAFDASTGALKWTFHTLPADATTGGANAWSGMAVDESRGLLFVPTGSPSPDYFGGLRAGRNDHANSIVVLRAATGELVWAFQTVHHDLWDYDVASPPLLFPFEKSGKGSELLAAVAVGSKTGHVFLFDRVKGTPLFPIEERRVPSSDAPGEEAWLTQPFPSKPASLVPQRLQESDIWAATPEDREACLRTLRSLRNEGVFTPPSLQGSLNVPGNIGGLHWGGMAWDERHRILIAPVNRLPAIIRLIPRDQFDSAKKAFPSRETTEQWGTPYGMSREFFLAPSGGFCTPPPWGELVGIHAASGEIAWRVPLGEVREQMGSPNLGGPAATGTGLVFIGASLDPHLRAFDTSNGRELWKARLPTSARATPLVFTTESGRQMVAIAAGGHDTPLSRLDTKLVVFGLATTAQAGPAASR